METPTSVRDYEIVPTFELEGISPSEAFEKALKAIKGSEFYDHLRVPDAEMYFYGNGNFSLGFVEGLTGIVRIADFGGNADSARKDAEFHLRYLANLRLETLPEDLQKKDVKFRTRPINGMCGEYLQGDAA